MSAVDIAQLASAVAALGALVAAFVEIRGLRKDSLEQRVGEILGVAVDTHVVTRPVKADQPGGRSLWEYRFTVHNPGRFPITRVEVRISFAIDVQRIHYDRSLDEPTRVLDLNAPVIPANTEKSWSRRITIDHVDHKSLRDTVASVTFVAPDAGSCTTLWPNPANTLGDSKRLRKLIGEARPVRSSS